MADPPTRIAAKAGPAVPFLDLVSPHRALEERLVEVFRRALRGGQFVGGPEVEGFEREFAAYCEAAECVAVNSGTDALRFAYMALGVRPGDEVITVSHTFIATTEAITQAGGTIRFVDIDERSMTMDPAAVRAAIGPRTVGLVPVHLYGQPADMDPLLQLAQRHGLWVVEDAAQAHGARYAGRRVGTLGRLGCFSFYPGKNLGSLGEGGAVTSGGRETALLQAVRRLREHGQSSKYIHDTEGYNGRLHTLQAAFLRIKLGQLDAWNAARQRVARWYAAALAGVPDVVLPEVASYAEHVFHLYVIRTPAREALRQHLAEEGIGTGLHYPRPLHLQQAYAALGYREGSLPMTERAAAQCLSLPMFPELTEAQVDRVADAIRRYIR
jgi:dTDP-4-amino-4,6-dideoxygalactose transaminase